MNEIESKCISFTLSSHCRNRYNNRIKSVNFVLVHFVLFFLKISVEIGVHAHHCRDPDVLPSLVYNADTVKETSGYILPRGNDVFHGLGTLIDVPPSYIDIEYQTNYSLGNCHDYKYRTFSFGYEPISVRSTCGFYYQLNIDRNRIPNELFNVECACNHSSEGMRCEKVYSYITVLRRTGCVNGVYVYSNVVEPLAVACTSVRPPKVFRRQRPRP